MAKKNETEKKTISPVLLNAMSKTGDDIKILLKETKWLLFLYAIPFTLFIVSFWIRPLASIGFLTFIILLMVMSKHQEKVARKFGYWDGLMFLMNDAIKNLGDNPKKKK